MINEYEFGTTSYTNLFLPKASTYKIDVSALPTTNTITLSFKDVASAGVTIFIHRERLAEFRNKLANALEEIESIVLSDAYLKKTLEEKET